MQSEIIASSGITVSVDGYYGEFGGAYVPEMLYNNVKTLQERYLHILSDKQFKDDFQILLKNYVGRPTPLYFAKNLSKKFKANIWLKREDLCHTGAHKINNAIGQILLAQRLGKKRIIAETGAGQHGVATATACAMMGMECVVYMGATDIGRQAPNVARMNMLGAKVVAVHSGSKTLKDATNEAIRDWINNPDSTHYVIGSAVGPHPYPDLVARLQSVISEEIKKQFTTETGNSLPDIVMACVGGGSNAVGSFYHFINEQKVTLIAVEAAGCGIETNQTAATTFRGKPGIIHGSKTLLMQTDEGQIIEPHSISAGLDYPGIGPLFAHMKMTGRVHFEAITDKEALEAAFLITKMEGIIPALESAHALALLSKKKFTGKNIVLCISGRGDKDLSTYTSFLPI